ncbi:MAG: helix-turn-helix domain-containing protein [Streptosporangiales bacterium]|jgi:AraC-like DNA-binding protein|nr:helix-turn-helix domain-containing protein [Streptosporangiales bacterium]
MPQFGDAEALQDLGSSLLVPMRITTTAPDQPFHAEATDASVGPVVISRVSVSVPGQIQRPARLIGSGDRHLVKVIMQRRGSAVIAQGGRRSLAGPGDLIAYDVNQPYEYLSRGPVDVVIMALPWPMLGPFGDLFRQRTALAVPGDRGIRSVIGTFFGGLADAALAGPGDQLSGPNAARLADAAASMLIAAFTDTPCERIELPTGLTDQILEYALSNLHDPDLTVGSAARRFGISPRYLHKLMRDRDIQFGGWVRRERMKRIRQDLLDPRLANRTAAVIAARWGVGDPDHLSRSLRAEFGQSAAEIRAGAGG